MILVRAAIKVLPRRVLSCRFGLALALLAMPALPAAAQSADPVSSVLTACVAPDLTAGARIALLKDSGWRIAGDSQSTRAIFGLTKAAQVALDTPDGPAAAARAFREQLKIELIPVGGTPGMWVMLSDVSQTLKRGADFQILLAAKDGLGVLYLKISESAADDLRIECGVFLAGPQRKGLIDEMFAQAGQVDTRETLPSVPGETRIEAGRKGGEGPLTLRAREYAPDAALNAALAAEDITWTLSLYAATAYSGFSVQ